MNCPNCTSILSKNPKHAQGAWECKSCGGVFYILACRQPKNEFSKLDAIAQVLEETADKREQFNEAEGFRTFKELEKSIDTVQALKRAAYFFRKKYHQES